MNVRRYMDPPCSALVRIIGRLSRSPRTLAVLFLLLTAGLAYTVRDTHHESRARRLATTAIASRNCSQIEQLKSEIRGIIDDGFNAHGRRYRRAHQGEYDRARARFKPLKCPDAGD